MLADDKCVFCGLGKIENQNYTIIAQLKGKNTKQNLERNFGMPNPESYRKAIRFMKEAQKFNRPIITFIDTKGAYPGEIAEERGQGEAIARSMLEMASVDVPIISFVIGEGSSGGALGLGVSNKVYMLSNSIYSILSPEGFASILWKDASRAKEAAEKMKLTANDLLDFKVIDGIIDELSTDDYDDDFIKDISQKMRDLIIKDTLEFKKITNNQIKEDRYKKFRNMGVQDDSKR